MERKEIKPDLKRKSRLPVDMLLKSWRDLGRHVDRIKTHAQFVERSRLLEDLLDEIGDDEDHKLIGLLDLVSRSIEEYESKNIRIPDVSPSAVLKFLIEQRALKQRDLSHIIPQSNLSAVLNGRRSLSVQQIARLASYFGVPVEVFITAEPAGGSKRIN